MDIPIKCIVYKKDTNRLNNIYKNIHPHIPNLEIISAVDGKTNELEYKIEHRTINDQYLKICRRGMLACMLSHIQVWQSIVSENLSECIILEDDISISPDFLQQFNLIYKELPKDYDFLYLFVHPDCKKENKSKYTYIVNGYKTYGTLGYLITQNTAMELIKLFKDKISTTLDDSISWYLEHYKKNYYCVKNNLVHNKGTLYFHRKDKTEYGSVISQTGVYAKTKPILDYYIDEGDWLFYPNCDSKDGDKYFNNDMTIKKLKEYYIQDRDIVGFNDLGYIKNSLKPKQEWIFVKSFFDGLYIKKSARAVYEDVKPAILLTGGCGFIGSHTSVELLKTGQYELVIIDDLSNSSNIVETIKDICRLDGVTPKIFFYQIDITDKNKFKRIFRNHPNIEAVIHFAALKAVGESVSYPLKYYRNNIMGLINLLELMKESKVDKIIFSSSATVYGEPSELPLTENAKINTLNPYGRTKLYAEEILKDVSVSDKIKVICLRYFNPVGAHSSGLIGENPKGIPNNLFPYILDVIKGKREQLNIFGGDYDTEDGTGVRDYIHVMDLAKGHISALEYLYEMDEDYDIFNLGTGEGYSVLNIINKFSEIYGKDIKYEIVERREGDSAMVYADPSKSHQKLGWKAEKNLDQMIRDSLRFNRLI